MLGFSRSLATAAQNSSGSRIAAGLILSRIPLVTPEINQLESQYYEYQNELRRRLMWTFPYYFYYKNGTVAERRFISAQRGPVSKQPGVWFPKGVPDVRHNRERSLKQEIVLPRESNEAATQGKNDLSRPIVPNSRVTDADKKGDLASLERKLARTLYLLVENSNGEWRFPSFAVENNTPLHIGANQGLKALGGNELLTWSVSNTPAGVIKNSEGDNIFLMKQHILAGKFDLQNSKEFQGFAWLTKDEIKHRVDENYYTETGFLLADI
ncbi:related to 54S ribosomal protein L17, mitochondrial [Zygosaccharomyces bailii]|nr:related to 54S ribosomal protein L17, mitochondrial [Zygosaccharomyces bailii]